MKLGSARALAAICALGALVGAAAPLTGGCQQSPTVVPVRSLQRSGKVSFVCLSPAAEPNERPLSECTSQEFTSICQYEYEDDAGDIDAAAYDAGGIGALATIYPHLYALVTQTGTGEVAVVDTSAVTGGVLDENPQEPGANFLKIGGAPTGIVSTPDSIATFVGSGDLNQPGVFAIPSTMIRPASSFGVPDICIGGGGGDAGGPITVPQFTSWPACSLPAPPGDIVLVYDPPDATGRVRDRCPAYPGQTTVSDSNLDFPVATDRLTTTLQGRPKLIATLPTLHGIVIIDAQTLFNQPAGSFSACPVDRFLELQVDLTGLAGQPPEPTGLACTNAVQNTPPLKSSYPATPGGISFADGKLYVGDLTAPVIHVVDMHGLDATGREVFAPCNPIERAPLLPTSAEVPERVVFAKKVGAADQLTPDFKRYLYASDIYDWSAMVFDISPTSTTRRPLQRQHPEWDPFSPRDRVKFAAPPADLIVVQRDVAAIDPVTGIARNGLLCNPDPNAVNCVASDTNCDLGTSYQTAVDYTTGAGPLKLRGEFAFAALTNGKLAVIDIADFDAPCRGPIIDSTLAGCGSQGGVELRTSLEVSCNVVSPNEARDSAYEATGSLAGNHVPGIQTFPLLYAADGSVVGSTDTVTAPMMVATLPPAATIPSACYQSCDPLACGDTCDTLPGCPLQTFVGGVQTPLDFEAGQCGTPCAPNGSPCGVKDKCCGDPANPTTYPGTCSMSGDTAGTCVSAMCLGLGQTCDPGQAPSCCSGNCTAGTCGLPVAAKSYVPGAVGTNNALTMNLEDPRAQAVDQNWAVTFEGALPNFTQRLSPLQITSATTATIRDESAQYCGNGVLPEAAFAEMLSPATGQPLSPTTGLPKTPLGPRDLADYVQVISDIPTSVDPYWQSTSSCDYVTCLNIFGPIDLPALATTRDLRITEAYQDLLQVEMRDPQPSPCIADGQSCASAGSSCCSGKDQCGGDGTCNRTIGLADIKCCFPADLQYNVRPGNQWMVVGDQSAFLHHVVADADTGVCRNACDPTFNRKNGRLVETPSPSVPAPVLDRTPDTIDPSPAFQNPMFRFAILSGTTSCTQATQDTDCPAGTLCSLSSLSNVTNPTSTSTGQCAAQIYGSTCTAADAATVCPAGGFCSIPPKAKTGQCLGPPASTTLRDHTFRYATNGSFAPLLVSLSTDGTSLVEPQSITYLPSTNEVAVCDGSFNGLIFVSLQSPAVSRSFF